MRSNIQLQQLAANQSTTSVWRRRQLLQLGGASLAAPSIAALLAACGGGGSGSASPEIAPTPQLVSVANFRDVAGPDDANVFRNANGRAMRRGVFYRSSVVVPNDDDLATLSTLDIGYVYDTRTPAEITALPDRIPADATLVHVNMLGMDETVFPPITSAEASIAMMEEGMRMMVTDPVFVAGTRELLGHFALNPRGQVFHCTLGKDRTGWVAALLQTLAGVSQEQIMADFMLSNQHLRYSIPMMYESILERFGKDYANAYAPILGVKERYLLAGITQANASFGSMRGFITKGLGLGDDVLQRLQARVLA